MQNGRNTIDVRGGAAPSIDGVSLIEFPVHRDARGNLIALDRQQSLPFEPRRVFYIFDVPSGAERAGHAISSDAVLIALQGSLQVVCDNGTEQQSYRLSGPTAGLHVRAGIVVRTREFSSGAILLVLSSTTYSDVSYSQVPFFGRDER
jgi:hypothetical protein